MSAGEAGAARPERGAALVAALEREFVTDTTPVSLGDWTVALLRPRSAEDLIDEQAFARDERLPYWAELWPSAQVLATRILREAGVGARLLELGCGLGLATAAALRAGFEVLATDYYEDALRFTRANAWRATGREPAVRLADWRAFPPDVGRHACVVAADILYERPYAALVASVLAGTLAPDGVGLVADPGRVAAGAFLERCEALGLRTDSTDVRSYDAGAIHQRITVHELRWR